MRPNADSVFDTIQLYEYICVRTSTQAPSIFKTLVIDLSRALALDQTRNIWNVIDPLVEHKLSVSIIIVGFCCRCRL